LSIKNILPCRRRDNNIKRVFEKYNNIDNISFFKFQDYLLNEPESVLDERGNPFRVFGRFFRKAISNPIRQPQKHDDNRGRYISNLFTHSIDFEIVNKEDFYNDIAAKPNENLHSHGGRSKCISILANMKKLRL
jgi:deoxyribodipyrimidine photolyase